MEGDARDAPVVVTGASGIAGRHLLVALRDAGIGAVGVSRDAGRDGIAADLADATAIERLPLAGGVIHAAALTPRRTRSTWEEFYATNVLMSERIAREAVRSDARFFIYLSTAGIYARRSQTATGRLYVASKLLAERRLRAVVGGRMPLWILRPASLYGEYDTGNVARLIAASAKGWLLLPSAPRQRKCLLYAGALARVVASEVRGGLVGSRTDSIADPSAHTMAELLAVIERQLRRSVRVIAMPGARVTAPAMDLGARLARRAGARGIYDLLEAARIAMRDVPCPPRNALDRHPELRMSLADGIGREVEWMRRVGAI